MPFHFEWHDESKRAMRYIAEGHWNWKDYHQAARASAFSLTAVDHPVDSVIDLRGGDARRFARRGVRSCAQLWSRDERPPDWPRGRHWTAGRGGGASGAGT